jgi:hypothetical protein
MGMKKSNEQHRPLGHSWENTNSMKMHELHASAKQSLFDRDTIKTRLGPSQK